MADAIKEKIAEIEAEVWRCPSKLACTDAGLRALLQARTRTRRPPSLCALPAVQMARTQKNKATSGHLGLLKVRAPLLLTSARARA